MARRMSAVGRVTVSERRSTSRPYATGVAERYRTCRRLMTALTPSSWRPTPASLLLDGLQRTRRHVDTKSSATDMVTEMDRAAEAPSSPRPWPPPTRRRPPRRGGHAASGSSGVRWVIDPLDGTTNYLYGYPAFAVSIAAEVDGAVAVGVVRDPLHDETFSAVRGDGAYCNDRRLAVAGPPTLATALLATGFAYKAETRARQARVLTTCCPRCATSAGPGRPPSTCAPSPWAGSTPTTSAAWAVGLRRRRLHRPGGRRLGGRPRRRPTVHRHRRRRPATPGGCVANCGGAQIRPSRPRC